MSAGVWSLRLLYTVGRMTDFLQDDGPEPIRLSERAPKDQHMDIVCALIRVEDFKVRQIARHTELVPYPLQTLKESRRIPHWPNSPHKE